MTLNQFNKEIEFCNKLILAHLIKDEIDEANRLKTNTTKFAKQHLESVYGKRQIPDFLMKKYNITYVKDSIEPVFTNVNINQRRLYTPNETSKRKLF